MSDTSASPPELWTEQRLARELGLTICWVRHQAKRGYLPCVPAGERFLFDPGPTLEAIRTRSGHARKPEPLALTPVRKAAQVACVSEKELRAAIAAGVVPSFAAGRSLYVDQVWVSEWAHANRIREWSPQMLGHLIGLTDEERRQARDRGTHRKHPLIHKLLQPAGPAGNDEGGKA